MALKPTLSTQGAFYVLPEMSSFFGPGVEIEGFGPVPDCDALAMYLIKVRCSCLYTQTHTGIHVLIVSGKADTTQNQTQHICLPAPSRLTANRPCLSCLQPTKKTTGRQRGAGAW